MDRKSGPCVVPNETRIAAGDMARITDEGVLKSLTAQELVEHFEVNSSKYSCF